MSKIANKIAQEIFKHGSYRLHESNHSPTIWLEDAIDQALEGKIINKSEVDALRKDAENMQSAQDAYNYTESVNSDLRRENADLRLQNKTFRERGDQYQKELKYITNLAFDSLAMQLPTPIFISKPEPGKIVDFNVEPIPWWKFWTPNW